MTASVETAGYISLAAPMAKAFLEGLKRVEA
jgi:hypothetical protein